MLPRGSNTVRHRESCIGLVAQGNVSLSSCTIFSMSLALASASLGCCPGWDAEPPLQGCQLLLPKALPLLEGIKAKKKAARVQAVV